MKGKFLKRRIGPVHSTLLQEQAERIGQLIEKYGRVGVSDRDNFAPYVRAVIPSIEDAEFLANIFGADAPKPRYRDGKIHGYDTYAQSEENVIEILSVLLEKQVLNLTRRKATIVLEILKDKKLNGSWTLKQMDLYVQWKRLTRGGSKFDEAKWREEAAQNHKSAIP